jgi:2-polyprenyl-3-methyl-5-hydroxy-6-metoxy-1,4-benzoquinol methylase
VGKVTATQSTAIIVAMPAAQTWDPVTYARSARFVSDLAAPLLELLAPRPGERILDLGCGDGVLTQRLVDLGCDVVAVDSSVSQVEAAKKLGLNAHAIAAEDLPYREEFDSVFSNAVLHWIKRADLMIAGVYRSLKPGDLLLNVEAMVVFTRSGPLLSRPWTEGELMARLVFQGIFRRPANTPQDWSSRAFVSIVSP